jgi:hypothetical protein
MAVRERGWLANTVRIVVIIAMAVSMLDIGAERAYAYCGGLTSYSGYWGSGGIMNWDDSYHLSDVQGYIQGQMPDPIVNVAAAWNMLSRYQNTSVIAQGGWVRRVGWSTYYVFAAWKDLAGSYTEVYQYVTPSLSHNYEIRLIPNTTSYEFSYNFSAWVSSQNLNWTPTQVEIAGETWNHGNHFPGSAEPGPYVRFWGSKHTVLGLQYDNNLSSIQNLASADVVGKTWLAGNDFYVWDKRCTDG